MSVELEARLRRYGFVKDGITFQHPMASEAADQLQRYREALEFYAKWHPQPSEGPWGADSTDFGERARQSPTGAKAMTLRVEVARHVALGLGDDFDSAFESKAQWANERGMRGGRFRDINEPMRGDYLQAADAAIAIARPIIEREAFERAAQVADNQAYAHGCEYFDGPELNSAHIAHRIRTLSTDKGDEDEDEGNDDG